MKTILPADDNQGLPKLSEYTDADFEELMAKTEALMADPKESKPSQSKDAEAAADLIRAKVATLYGQEPSAKEELAEAKAAGNHRSKHQKFIYELTNSGKSLAAVQVEWHNYYNSLPDHEKHEVWQEFYEQHSRAEARAERTPVTPSAPTHPVVPRTRKSLKPHNETRTVGEIKEHIANRVSAKGKLTAKHHIKSLAFGLGMGALVLVLISFSFFNERIIAPFISPSRNVSATPIIGSGGNIGTEPKILIPKINLEVPVVYDLGTNEENAVQNALENGVVHYSGTPNPGEQGNVAVVGHSSNNILNKGKYKFAFVLLNRLEAGDIFYLQKDGVRYTYQVFENRVVPPTDVSVLGPSSKPNTATLITCDPPGTSINRRVVVGEQISPDPKNNKASSVSLEAQPEILPSNAPSLWQRLFGN